jgi:hypothetical protein
MSKRLWAFVKSHPVGFAFVVVVSLWLATPLVVRLLFTNMGERGQFGDLFGTVNSLFTGLGFIGLIWTIVQQQEQLSLQREELRLQREEMAASRDELAKQAQATRKLAEATSAQIAVEGFKLEVEAERLSVEDRANGRFKDVVEQMRRTATAIKGLSDRLEQGPPSDPPPQ